MANRVWLCDNPFVLFRGEEKLDAIHGVSTDARARRIAAKQDGVVSHEASHSDRLSEGNNQSQYDRGMVFDKNRLRMQSSRP